MHTCILGLNIHVHSCTRAAIHCSSSYLFQLPSHLQTPGSLLEYESSDTELAEGGERKQLYIIHVQLKEGIQ